MPSGVPSDRGAVELEAPQLDNVVSSSLKGCRTPRCFVTLHRGSCASSEVPNRIRSPAISIVQTLIIHWLIAIGVRRALDWKIGPPTGTWSAWARSADYVLCSLQAERGWPCRSQSDRAFVSLVATSSPYLPSPSFRPVTLTAGAPLRLGSIPQALTIKIPSQRSAYRPSSGIPRGGGATPHPREPQ
jgi:hypothetical protein